MVVFFFGAGESAVEKGGRGGAVRTYKQVSNSINMGASLSATVLASR